MSESSPFNREEFSRQLDDALGEVKTVEDGLNLLKKMAEPDTLEAVRQTIFRYLVVKLLEQHREEKLAIYLKDSSFDLLQEILGDILDRSREPHHPISVALRQLMDSFSREAVLKLLLTNPATNSSQPARRATISSGGNVRPGYQMRRR